MAKLAKIVYPNQALAEIEIDGKIVVSFEDHQIKLQNELVPDIESIYDMLLSLGVTDIFDEDTEEKMSIKDWYYANVDVEDNL